MTIRIIKETGGKQKEPNTCKNISIKKLPCRMQDRFVYFAERLERQDQFCKKD